MQRKETPAPNSGSRYPVPRFLIWWTNIAHLLVCFPLLMLTEHRLCSLCPKDLSPAPRQLSIDHPGFENL